MEHFPSNSHSERMIKENKDEPKKIDKIVEGGVFRRKKRLGKKFSDVFLGGDARNAASYVVFEVLIPAAKDVIVEMFSQWIDRTIHGESKTGNRRPGNRFRGNGYVSYNQYSSSSLQSRRDEPRHISRRARATHDFDEIVLDFREEADAVLNKLFDIITKYGVATVADLYELVGITGKYTDDKYGWTDIQGAGIVRVKGGYLLDLPVPEQID